MATMKRIAWFGVVAAVTALAAPVAATAPASAAAPAPVAAPPPQANVGFLQISPQPVADRGTVHITPSDPCPPPSAATAPFAVVSDNGSDAGAPPQRLASVPVAADGSWSATATLVGTGGHSLQAFCLSGPQAEGAYASYEATFVDVVTRSLGFWAASAHQQAPSAAGDAPDYSMGERLVTPAAPVVAVAADPTSGLGYWTASGDGGVYTFGRAQFYGSAADVHLAAPLVGMAVTPSGHGYWLVGADGGVFTYGDARFYGSGAGGPDTTPVVGIAPTGLHTALGYLLAHADGAVFAYTAAGTSMSSGPLRLVAPVVGIASTPSEMGYWLAAGDGGVFLVRRRPVRWFSGRGPPQRAHHGHHLALRRRVLAAGSGWRRVQFRWGAVPRFVRLTAGTVHCHRGHPDPTAPRQ